MSKQTSVYLLSKEVEHFKDKHLTPYVEKWGKGGLKMDLNLVKCDSDIFHVHYYEQRFKLYWTKYKGLQKFKYISILYQHG